MFMLLVRIDEEELGIGFNVMGRKDFFEKFTICFSDEKKIIQFI